MADHTILINGAPYIRSRDAARLVNLVPDYVSRLAREKQIDGTQVGHTWFVNLASLQEFTAGQQRQKEIYRAQLAELRREEQRDAGHPSATRHAQSIFLATTIALIICIATPYKMLAAHLAAQQLPTHSPPTFLTITREIRERGIRTTALTLTIAVNTIA